MPQLMGLAFFAVSGSAYGIEEAVSVAGPCVALGALLLAPVVWSAPMLMVTAELSTALPHSGGYIVWVNTAFGALPSLLNGMCNLLCNVLDCALYPVMLVEFLQRAGALSALLPPQYSGADPSQEGWLNASPWMLASAIRLALVALAALVNVVGANVVGVGASLLMGVVCAPFVPLVAAAVASPHFTPSVLFRPGLFWRESPDLWPVSYNGWYFFFTLILWNTCGYDSAGMVAAEVPEGQRTYPRALWGALALTTAMYVLPIAACASSVHNWPAWRDGQFPRLAEELSGPGLAAAVTAASAVSMGAVLCTLLCTTSRALSAMSQLRMLPAAVSRLHPRFGTPWVAVLLNASMISVATTLLRFDALLQLSMFFYCINVLAQCGALLRLRATHPHRLRPTRTAPAPLLACPATIAAAVLLCSPLSHWLVAASLLGGTLAVYAALTSVRRPHAAPSSRALAAAERLGVVEGNAYRSVAAEVVQAFEMTELRAEVAPDDRVGAAISAELRIPAEIVCAEMAEIVVEDVVAGAAPAHAPTRVHEAGAGEIAAQLCAPPVE